ncbi:hypothetical protein O7606_04195 [Micromonospora sp. WMMD882]|uniref:hypothetical protein n=1 Tax=Micromonospora sp. WMMD882 TaxID=3015151 RepID=UPI00248B7626|nr:hypothetical protein [Micromonospora sp. WMMD882]WBB80598.1 hypothetical protein O7606_04195 [Micromonospora sp. WMMD882]
MIDTEIQQRITQALAGRHGQQRFVDDLAAAWTSLVETFDQLVAAVENGRTSARATNAPYADPVDDALTGLLGDPTAATRIDRLRQRLADAGRQVDAVRARVRRETVNIGVIGGTKVGKSTLLRTITDLPDTVIPTTRFNPTTAATSRIYHTLGEPRATLDLHTWESFRDSYLAPLHDLAGLDAVPADPEAFRRFPYPQPGSEQAGHARVDDYLRKLRAAQVSFASYAHLLRGPRRTITVEFARLRPFVAYPDVEEGDPVEVQPFHAVRSVRIDQTFPEFAAARLGLIDLPGAREAGLDIDRQFLSRVKNEIDLLVSVKRGDTTTATYLADDSYTRSLADSARAGVPLEDYYLVVVNRDAEHDPNGDYFANTVKSVAEISRERNIRVLTADVVDRDDVFAHLVRPVLEHLSARLAEMDRAVVREALTLVTAVAGEIAGYADEALDRSRDLTRLLPDQENEFRNLAEQLRDDLANDLAALIDRYDGRLASGQADLALETAIDDAVEQAREWVRAGLGRGDRNRWTTAVQGRYIYGSLEATQDEYYRAKTEITEIFSRIDVSLDESVERLLEDVAEVLRGRLTTHLVPAGPQALTQLRDTAESRRALILRDALRQLCQLKVDYGSVVLRVTQPIIRGIHWDRTPGVPAPVTGPPSGRPGPGAAPLAAPAPMTAPAPGPGATRPPAARVGRPAAAGQWVRMPDGSLARNPAATTAAPPVATSASTPPAPAPAPAPPVPPARPSPVAPGAADPAGPVGGGVQAAARRGVSSLYDEVTAVVDGCVTELEAALRDETRVMARTLAAAADRFFDTAIRTNHTERDYEYLCRPYQRVVWPDRFDGGVARLGADLARTQDQARLTAAAVEAVRRLAGGPHLPPVPEST